MNRRNFIATLGLSATVASVTAFAKKKTMKIYFWRHATFILEVNGVKMLVDPMLSAKDAMDPVKISRNSFRIPMVDLPISGDQLKKELGSIDAVIITHTHRDHWDEKARELLDKKLTVIGQPTDAEAIKSQGFENFISVDTAIDFKGLKIYRTGGQHGTGDIGKRMGQVSGYVIEFDKQKIYIAGDTIWCTEVEQALTTHRLNFVVLNAGAARFDQGDAITMTAEDVIRVGKALPSAKLIAVHMETVNHCDLKRSDLKEALVQNKMTKQCLIPADGEMLTLG